MPTYIPCTIKLTNSLTCQYFLLELIVRIIELVPHSRVDKISNGGGSRGLIGAVNSDISGGIDCTCPSKFYILNIIYPQNKKEILDALHDDKRITHMKWKQQMIFRNDLQVHVKIICLVNSSEHIEYAYESRWKIHIILYKLKFFFRLTKVLI